MKLQPFSKTYDGVTVLDFPGLELQPGMIYAIIGANGSGKSTLFKLILGERGYDTGQIQKEKGKLIIPWFIKAPVTAASGPVNFSF